jgi:competence protein ComEC
VSVSALTLLAALAPRRLRVPLAVAAAALFLFLAAVPGATGPREGVSVEALDVGQGDAILLRWGDRALLVDGGGGFDLEATEFGRTRVLPKLLDRGVTRLDAVILSHPHPDHALGLFAIVDELPVARVWTGSGRDEAGFHARLAAAAALRGVPLEALHAGRHVAWEDASLAVLHSGGRLRKVDGINNQSLVLRFARRGASALLTGDAGAPTERAMADDGLLAPIDLLKVGHHGSRTSTSDLLLEAVRPRVALLSCGRENRFGHPTPEVLAALARARVPLFRTDRLSDVEVRLSSNATRLSWRGLP